MTIQEMREELNNWKMLLATKDELIKELHLRIQSTKKEMKKERNKDKKKALSGVIAEYENVLQQTTENIYAAPGQITKLEHDIRSLMKSEQIELFKKGNSM